MVAYKDRKKITIHFKPYTSTN